MEERTDKGMDHKEKQKRNVEIESGGHCLLRHVLKPETTK